MLWKNLAALSFENIPKSVVYKMLFPYFIGIEAQNIGRTRLMIVIEEYSKASTYLGIFLTATPQLDSNWAIIIGDSFASIILPILGFFSVH
jgi:hypothetical protein